MLEIAQANAAEKERLAKEAEERAKREAEEKRQELLNFTQKQQASIEAEKTEASLNTLFDQNYSAPEANVKKTLSIEVSNPAGYGQIFMFWFEREGKNLPDRKIEKEIHRTDEEIREISQTRMEKSSRQTLLLTKKSLRQNERPILGQVGNI